LIFLQEFLNSENTIDQ
jgi:hypothetical protein